MNEKKKIGLLVGIVAVVLVLWSLFGNKSEQSAPQSNPVPVAVNTSGSNEPGSVPAGSVATGDNVTGGAPCYSANDVQLCTRRAALSSATTTPWAFNPGLPTNSTSTVRSFACKIINATTTATTLTFGIGTSNFSTTTRNLGEISIPANTQVTAFASTTDGRAILAPTERLVTSLRGGADAGGASIYSPVGFCSATVERL